MKICDWCGVDFKPNVSYQIYCSVECRELATKEKVNERYQQKKRKRLAGKKRKCTQCGVLLSAYNSDILCGTCVINQKQVDKALKQLKGFIDYERFS